MTDEEREAMYAEIREGFAFIEGEIAAGRARLLPQADDYVPPSEYRRQIADLEAEIATLRREVARRDEIIGASAQYIEGVWEQNSLMPPDMAARWRALIDKDGGSST